MTRAQIERRRIRTEWNRLKRRADAAPHGVKQQRAAELRAWVADQLRREPAPQQLLGGVR